MKGVKVVHILDNFYWYGICRSPGLNFQMFLYEQKLILCCFWVDFLPEQGWQARWCIRNATVFWSIKKWSKLDQKIDFLADVESLFVYILVHPMRYTPRFCQMKELVPFIHQYSICGCEMKNFQSFLYWFSIHEIAHFWDFLGPYSPKYWLILLKLWP